MKFGNFPVYNLQFVRWFLAILKRICQKSKALFILLELYYNKLG